MVENKLVRPEFRSLPITFPALPNNTVDSLFVLVQ
jgi:hypothetical protein